MISYVSNNIVRIPRAKIARAVEEALNGHAFELQAERSPLGGMMIIRVITRAWERLQQLKRIAKLRAAVEEKLSQKERESILRFNVLTPKEYAWLTGGSEFQPMRRAAKRKMGKPAAQRAKRTTAKK